jgi:two-component system sensor histidine kinase CpxA
MFAKPGFNLSTKIFLIALLNLLLIASVLAVFMRVQYRFDLQSFLISPAHDRILSTGRQIALELRDTDRSGWDQLLQRYAEANKVELRLTDDDGRQLAGSTNALPATVLGSLNRQSHDETRNSPLLFLGTTKEPKKHWVGVRIPIPSTNERHHVHGVLVAASSSLLSTPFFFDPKPWVAVALALVVVSILCWLPFGRRLMRSVSHISRATGQIAEGQFKIQLPITRHDELGQLSASINRMATRLDGYVAGQKRFLGDTAHELCSPIARMQVAVGILERSAGPNQTEVIGDLRDDLEQMSKLVNDVLAFSKAGLRTPDVTVSNVHLADVVRNVLDREVGQPVLIKNDVPADLYARANLDLLGRALANIVRNAVRYAGAEGPISITASSDGDLVLIRVADCGPGLPESDLDRVFDPFFRLEFSRGSDSGGVGLGLAIVKSCIEACGGSVVCRNRSQGGLEVEMALKVAV